MPTLPSGRGVRLYRPAGATDPCPALLWIHGGGYMIGSPEHDDALCRRYTERLGIMVAAVRYRLAPENPSPATLEDYTVPTWLAHIPGVDEQRIAIGGAGAGVPCHLDEVAGAFHGFPAVAPQSTVTQQYFDSMCAALRGAMTMAG